MFRRFFRSRHAVLPIEMPAHILESVLHLGGPIAVKTAANNSVITDRPIAIQTKSHNVHGQRVSGRCRLDVEGSGFRIAAENARDTFLVRAASIDRGGMNRVTGSDSQHRFVFRRKSPIENGWHKLMPLRSGTGTTLGNNGRGKLV